MFRKKKKMATPGEEVKYGVMTLREGKYYRCINSMMAADSAETRYMHTSAQIYRELG